MNSRTTNSHTFDEQRSVLIRQMLVSVTQKDSLADKHFRRMGAARVVIPSALLALTLTAGTAIALQSPVTEKDQVACFARAERHGDSFPGTIVSVSNGTRVGDEPSPAAPIAIEDAVSTCSDLWAQHALDASTPSGTPTGHGQQDLTFSHPVPSPLTVCVWDGIAAVVPGDSQICAKVGLSEKIATAPS